MIATVAVATFAFVVAVLVRGQLTAPDALIAISANTTIQRTGRSATELERQIATAMMTLSDVCKIRDSFNFWVEVWEMNSVDSTLVLQMYRHAKWEHIKGELEGLLALFPPGEDEKAQERWEKLYELIGDFKSEVEGSELWR